MLVSHKPGDFCSEIRHGFVWKKPDLWSKMACSTEFEPPSFHFTEF
jgi:hypothetical protein